MTADRTQLLSPEKERQILDHRAELLAQPRIPSDARIEQGVRFLRCRLGASEIYGIPYRFLEEVIYRDAMERVPGTPAFVSGVIARRGELLTVIDPAYFFRVAPAAATDEERIVVVRHGEVQLGLLFNAVVGEDLYYPSQLLPPIASSGVASLGHVEGIHAAAVTVLRIDSLLEDPMLIVDQRNDWRRGESLR